MIYERVISDFDKHIRMERRHYGDFENRPSYWKKNIFVSSFNFQISDWKGVRSGDYYDKRDSLKGIERDKFIYDRIIEYKKMVQLKMLNQNK